MPSRVFHPEPVDVSQETPAFELPQAPGLESVIPLLEALPGAVLVLDPDGIVHFINRSAEHRIDRARRDVVGRDLFREVLPELEREGRGECYRKGMQEAAAPIRWEAAIGSGAGRRWGLFTARPYETSSSRWGLLVIEDISAVRREAERRKRTERFAAIGELAAGAAHEINNPLASIKGFAQLLSRDTLDLGQQQALEIISQECNRVARIVDDLLEFAGQQQVSEREALDLSTIAENLLALKRYALETAGIAIEVDLVRGLSLVEGERGALQRLLLTLVNHAERALIRREGERRLVLRTRESNDGVVLYIGHNGPGLPRERLRDLLEADGDADSGLDLRAAAAIVRDHGGLLWIESGEGKGTTFSVRLPCTEETVDVAPAALPAPVPAQRTRLRVLVADDEPTLRLALAMFLGRLGYEVAQAEDAEQAFQMAATGEFDVALVDVRMPGDGLLLLERLEAAPAWKGRAILMTGDHTQARVREQIRAGRPHLTKPFDMSEAVRLIEQMAETTAASPSRVGLWTST